MSVKTLAEIKSAFETGDKPTGQDFIDLIDTLHDDTTGLVHTNRTLLDAYTGPVDLSGYATLTNVDDRIQTIGGYNVC